MNGFHLPALALPLLLLCHSTSLAIIHPFHISTAEMEQNGKTGRFEVALKMHAADLEQALARQEKRAVHIEKDADAAQLLTSYLETHFFLLDKRHLQLDADQPAKIDPKLRCSKIHFVGHELKTNWLWIYFEVEPLPAQIEVAADAKEAVDLKAEPQQAETKQAVESESTQATQTTEPPRGRSLVLVNSVLLDVTDGQINTVAVRHAGKKFSLRTTARQAWADMQWD